MRDEEAEYEGDQQTRDEEVKVETKYKDEGNQVVEVKENKFKKYA
jgi:hypothetical protein